MLAAFAYWGFNLEQELTFRFLAGIGAPAVAIAIWGRWVAPKSAHQLEDPPRFVIELALFAAASLGLYLADQMGLGVLLISVFLVDRVALMLTGGTGLESDATGQG